MLTHGVETWLILNSKFIFAVSHIHFLICNQLNSWEVYCTCSGPRDFPRKDHEDPPLKMWQNYLLKRVPVVSCLGALTGPRENPPPPPPSLPLKMWQNSLYWTLTANLWGGYRFVLCLWPPKKASWPGILASGKVSRTKVVLARKLGKQGLGSTPATIGEYKSVGGCLCALRARGWRMCIF